MVSELRYLRETKPELLLSAEKHGWSIAKLEVVFVLNCFYQRILAPLAASAYNPHVVGTKIPIRFGAALKFDNARVTRMREMDASFMALCLRAEVDPWMLSAQRAGDLIWQIAKSGGQ